tara:strand:+ start:2466 stop:2609 length:144 start_codon:yes stop_codon:yes gene_type:complete
MGRMMEVLETIAICHQDGAYQGRVQWFVPSTGFMIVGVGTIEMSANA